LAESSPRVRLSCPTLDSPQGLGHAYRSRGCSLLVLRLRCQASTGLATTSRSAFPLTQATAWPRGNRRVKSPELRRWAFKSVVVLLSNRSSRPAFLLPRVWLQRILERSDSTSLRSQPSVLESRRRSVHGPSLGVCGGLTGGVPKILTQSSHSWLDIVQAAVRQPADSIAHACDSRSSR